MAKFDFNKFPEVEKPSKDKKGFSFDQHPEVESEAISKPTPDIGIGDVLRPVIQGASLGTADELAGGLGALGDVATGQVPLNFEKIAQSYKKNRDVERELNRASEEAHPALYKGLELGSSFLAPIPGAGILKLGKNASTIAKLGKMALEGATAGGIAGAGYSEGTTPEEVAKHAALGATLGATPAAALGGVAGAAQIAKHVPIFGIGKTAAGLAEGIAGHIPSNVKLTSNVEKTLESLGSKKRAIADTYEKLIKDAEAHGVKLDSSNIDVFVNELKAQAANNRSPEVKKDIEKVLDLVSNYTKENGASRQLTAREAQNLKSNLGNIGQFKDPSLVSAEGKAFAKEAKSGVASELENAVPGFKAADSDYHKLENTLKQLGIKPESLYTKNAETGALEINPKALQAVQTMLKKATNEKATGDIGQKSAALLGGGLKSLGLKNTVPDLLEKARVSTVLEKPLGKFGAYAGYGAQKIAPKFGKAFGVAPGIAGVFKEPRNSLQLSEDTQDASKQALERMAQTADSVPGLQKQSERLSKAIESGDLQSKNQVLFDLLQRPSFRKKLEGTPKTEENNEE